MLANPSFTLTTAVSLNFWLLLCRIMCALLLKSTEAWSICFWAWKSERGFWKEKNLVLTLHLGRLYHASGSEKPFPLKLYWCQWTASCLKVQHYYLQRGNPLMYISIGTDSLTIFVDQVLFAYVPLWFLNCLKGGFPDPHSVACCKSVACWEPGRASCGRVCKIPFAYVQD